MRTIKEKNEYLTNKAIYLNAGHTIKNGRGTKRHENLQRKL